MAPTCTYWPFIVEARRNGAEVLHDRSETRTAPENFPTATTPSTPAQDAALALAMMHVIVRDGLEDRDYIERHTLGFDELKTRVAEWTPDRAAQLTGIAANDISRSRPANTPPTKPAALQHLNYGVQRPERGRNVRANHRAPSPPSPEPGATPAGGVQLSTSYAFHLNRTALEMPELQPHPTRIVNMTQLGAALTTLNDPPVKALVVYNSNPAAIAPDQNAVRKGLRRDDLFTVVLEQFHTDTADFADIVLPATTFLEHTDLYTAYGHYYLQLARPALPAPGEAAPISKSSANWPHAWASPSPRFPESDDDMIRTVLASGHPFLEGITLEALEKNHFVRLNMPDPLLPFSEGGFKTPSGKCEFHAETLDYTPPIESRHGDPALMARFPLEMISPKGDDNMNSTLASRAENDATNGRLTLHPADAKHRQIAAGDSVRVFNDRGELTVEAGGRQQRLRKASSACAPPAGRSSLPMEATPIRSPRSASPIKAEGRRSIVVWFRCKKSNDPSLIHTRRQQELHRRATSPDRRRHHRWRKA